MNEIKVIKRMAYGFRDDDYFFLKIRAVFPGNAGRTKSFPPRLAMIRESAKCAVCSDGAEHGLGCRSALPSGAEGGSGAMGVNGMTWRRFMAVACVWTCVIIVGRVLGNLRRMFGSSTGSPRIGQPLTKGAWDGIRRQCKLEWNGIATCGR